MACTEGRRWYGKNKGYNTRQCYSTNILACTQRTMVIKATTSKVIENTTTTNAQAKEGCEKATTGSGRSKPSCNPMREMSPAKSR